MLTKALNERPSILTIAIGIVGVVALVTVIIVAIYPSSGNAATAPKAPVATHPPTSTSKAPAAPAGPMTVTAISPANGTGGVATDEAITVTYSMPLSAPPPTPTITPAVAGTWTHSGSTLTFLPAGGWLPYDTEHVTVPAGATATVDGRTITSTSAATSTFTVSAGSETRLEQLLAQLHYLPFTFVPAQSSPRIAGANEAPAASTAVSTSPVPGTLQWSWSSVPATLSSLWQPGQYNVMDKGAIMAFQSDHNMTMDGVAGQRVWSALLAAATAGQNDSNPYDYLVASKSLPEKLTVYRDGKVLYTTLVNTGVSGADTQSGTFPVYLRFQSTTMSGTNVDGTKYVDPGIPWVAYFNGGDAVHGYVRGGYGYPQSNGCVELPVSNAAHVWTMDPYGTLVTVTS